MEAKGIDFAAIPRTAMRVLTSPAAFFREMPKTGGFVEPLVFMVVMSVVSGVLGGVLHALTDILGLHLYAGVAMEFMAIIMMPVLAAVGSAIFGFIVAGILFVIWKLMGSHQDYETAYRCTAYLSAIFPITTLLGIIPYAGGAIGLSVILYYLVTVSVETHHITSGKAWTVFGILTAVFVVLSVSAQITARRFARNIEQASESWKDASKEMQKAAEEMQQRMKEEMEKQNPPVEPSK